MDLNDIPELPLPTPTTERRERAEAIALLQQIEDLRERAAWAADTLDGIYQTVEKSGRATDGQRQAVQNIEDRVNTRYPRRRW